jgi:outer membrane lipoprotein-sorting protein
MEWYVQLLAKVFENSLLIVTVIFLSGCIQQQAQKESGFASTQSSQKESVYMKILLHIPLHLRENLIQEF